MRDVVGRALTRSPIFFPRRRRHHGDNGESREREAMWLAGQEQLFQRRHLES